MIIRPTDLETTGLEPTDEVVEIGAYDIRDATLYTTGYWSLVKPARPIPASASAVHHITDADVIDAPPWNDAWRTLIEMENDGEELVFAAHMAAYERTYLDPLIKAKWICTWKCALRLWPDMESHSLQALRYALALPADPVFASPPHRARPDAYVCGLLVLELLKHQSVETLIEWSAEPPVFTKFDFGQFKGKPLSAADNGYLDWLANKEHSMGDDWRWNAKREIERRASARQAAITEEKQLYVAGAVTALSLAATVRDLELWYAGESPNLARLGIYPTDPEYVALIAACAKRKAEIIAAGAPIFRAEP
jgi:exodeoxyribonuclease X